MTIRAGSLLHAIEGFYTTLIIDALYREGVLDALKEPKQVEDLANQFAFDPMVLDCILEFAATHCDLIHEDPIAKSYAVEASYEKIAMPAHLLDQYVGAYGTSLHELEKILRFPSTGAHLTNRERHAKAFSDAGTGPEEFIQFLVELKLKVVLEVGCGSGGILIRLARSDPSLKAIGIDQNEQMLKQARAAASPNVNERITWICGDLLEIISGLDKSVRDAVDVVVALSVANEFFGERTIDEFLGGLSRAFPNRLLFIGDYYGCLGAPVGKRVANLTNASDVRRAILHDIVQVVSGQGVPPRTVEEWQVCYERAGCSLIQVNEAVSGGVGRFLHLVQLKENENAH